MEIAVFRQIEKFSHFGENFKRLNISLLQNWCENNREFGSMKGQTT
jgi:hypothetical protein